MCIVLCLYMNNNSIAHTVLSEPACSAPPVTPQLAVQNNKDMARSAAVVKALAAALSGRPAGLPCGHQLAEGGRGERGSGLPF